MSFSVSHVFQKITAENNFRKMKLAFFIFGFLLLFLNFSFFAGRSAVDIPVQDEWDFTPLMTGNANLSEILFYQHNEHRIGTGLAIMQLMAHFTNWSQINEVKFVLFQILIACLVILAIKKYTAKKLKIPDLFIPFLFFNIFQYENFTSGFQMTFVFPLVFFVFGLWALKISDIKIRNAILVSVSLFGAFSSFHGLIIPVIFIFFLLFDYWKFREKRNSGVAFSTIIFELLIIVSYFIGYKRYFDFGKLFSSLSQIALYSATALNNGFFLESNRGIIPLYLLLIIVFIFLIFGFKKIWKGDKLFDSPLFGVLLISFSLLFILTLAVGRSAAGPEQAVSSRYITFSMLLPLGLYFIFSGTKNGYLLEAVLIMFVVWNYAQGYHNVEKGVITATNQKRSAVECYKKSQKKDFDSCYKIFKLYPNQERLDLFIPTVIELKKNN